jgi:hypothetical protein
LEEKQLKNDRRAGQLTVNGEQANIIAHMQAIITEKERLIIEKEKRKKKWKK